MAVQQNKKTRSRRGVDRSFPVQSLRLAGDGIKEK